MYEQDILFQENYQLIAANGSRKYSKDKLLARNLGKRKNNPTKFKFHVFRVTSSSYVRREKFCYK